MTTMLLHEPGTPIPPRASKIKSSGFARLRSWIKQSFFKSTGNTITTLILVLAAARILPGALDWLFFSATFSGEGRADCSPNAACWIPVIDYFEYYIYGPYPADQRWRIELAFALGILVFPLLVTKRLPRGLVLGYIAALPILLWLLLKGGIIFQSMPSTVFGGLMLTFFLGAISMCLSLPVAILLALGRQSKLPIIRWLCVIYIEFVRAVPLLTFMFMASLMLQIFLPEGMEIDRLFRILVVMIFVSAAYKAEILRGALQALPSGQTEAAYAMGSSYWQTILFVTMPQALRNSVPALITNFIGLFKETTLVTIVGLLELTGAVRASFKNSEWIGLDVEGLVVLSIIFFAICYSIARYGASLERDIAASKR